MLISSDRNNSQTGNPRHFLALLVLFLTLIGTVLYESGLTQNKITLPPSLFPTVTSQSDPATPNETNTELPQVLNDSTSVQRPPTNTPTPATAPNSQPQDSSNTYKVTSVVDGDTIKVLQGTKTETIRLIGVDTPELHDPRKAVQCFGKEASDYVHSKLNGQTVRLEADTSQANRDKYNRLLRYVFLADGTNFNKQIITQGYGFEYTYDAPYQYQAEFKNAQTTALTQSKGLWSATTCGGVHGPVVH